MFSGLERKKYGVLLKVCKRKKMRKVIAVACTIQVTQTTISLRFGITTQKVKIKAVVGKKKKLARHLLFCIV